jgi:hypothetical protein
MVEVGIQQNFKKLGVLFIMTTTGELRAIIEELQLVDIGDAASYLGEEVMVEDESLVSGQPLFLPSITAGQLTSSVPSSAESTN